MSKNIKRVVLVLSLVAFALSNFLKVPEYISLPILLISIVGFATLIFPILNKRVDKLDQEYKQSLKDTYCGNKVKVRLSDGNIRVIEVSEYISKGKNDRDIVEGKLLETSIPSDQINTTIWAYVDDVEVLN